MLSLTNKKFRTPKFDDKQNFQSKSNVNDRPKSSNKENIKTGVQVKNKIKNKNLFKPPASVKKSPVRKNTHLNEKNTKKILRTHGFDQENINLSSTSSIKSMKSVTFSVNSFVDCQLSVSKSNNRKGSILKNKLTKNQSFSYLEKQSRASSSCSHLKSIDQGVENTNSNNIFMRKYEKLIKGIKETNQKYTDPIYPPCTQSIFLQSPYTKDFINKLNSEGYQIKWIRLAEIFSDKQICLWSSDNKSRVTKGFIHSSGRQNNYMQTVLNCINKGYVMQKFFENQEISNQGVYYVKMHQTQTNQWKYIIIDDFIPVVVSNKKNDTNNIIKPAFLNVESDSDIVEIWPFLVQKAFAKYYSTYDSLVKGNTLDFFQEILGEFFKTIPTNSSSQKQMNNRKEISNLLKNPFNIILAQNAQGLFYPVNCNKNGIQIFDTQNNFKPQKIDKSEIEKYFKFIHVIEAKKYSNHINGLIKLQNAETLGSLEEINKNIILRSFALKENSHCILALAQKEERFHRNFKTQKGTKGYCYSWMRMILVMKQSTGYRWIDGCYDNKKTIKIQADLNPGEYFVIIIPEWQSQPYNLKLSLCSNTETFFQRKNLKDHQTIVEDSCMDLAQSLGKLIQINNNICSYNYIDYKMGFIIENINNQKTFGEVKILRTLDGLQNYNITPVNADFQQNKRLEIRIPSSQSYTVVLKVSGGVDRTFLQQFDFGI